MQQLEYDLGGVVDWVGTDVDTASGLLQRFIVRGVGESGPDPELVLTRERTVAPGEVNDRLRLANVGTHVLAVDVAVDIASDLARMDAVKAGRTVAEVGPEVEVADEGVRLRWADTRVGVMLTARTSEW